VDGFLYFERAIAPTGAQFPKMQGIMDAKGIGKSGIASVSADLRKPDGKNVSPERFPFLSPMLPAPSRVKRP
jgi:hypothetical protein